MHLIVDIRHINDNLIAILVEHALDRQTVEILRVVTGNLLTIHAQGLREIAVTIEETDAAEIDVGVRGFLQVVTCQHTKTTRINLQHLVEAILHREVSN